MPKEKPIEISVVVGDGPPADVERSLQIMARIIAKQYIKEKMSAKKQEQRPAQNLNPKG